MVCVFLLSCPALGSAQAIYSIELIVFEQKNAAGLTAEHWSNDDVVLPTLNEAMELISSANTAAGNERKLSDIARKLNTSPAYRVLFHTTWKQAAVDSSAAKGVRLTNERKLTGDNANPVYEVEGVANLSAGRFLHLNLNLVFSKLIQESLNPLPSMNADVQQPESLRRVQLKESRRIKSKELHFFDHPLFGVIAYVAPIAQVQ